ncbi:MAG: hypothetical protein HYX92_02110 [Chloroflexi bacterium]|nr:hypothetical protein [Chloroflexota bacterium]
MALAREAAKAVLEVLDPVSTVAKKNVPPAHRLSDLNGRKIGLYWNTKPGGNIGLEEAARLIGQRYEDVSFQKFYNRYPVSKAILDSVSRSGCDAIISATGD